MDVNVNVFVPFDTAGPVITSLEALGFVPERPADQWAPTAGVRLLRPGEVAHLDLR